VYWIVGIATAAVIFFILINRPKRLTLSLIAAAENARTRADWAAAARLFGHSYETAGLLKEPLRGRLRCQIEIRRAGVLYRQGEMGRAEEMVRRGVAGARQHFLNETSVLLQGCLTWGDICADQGRHEEAEQQYRVVVAGEEDRANLAGAIFALQKLSDSLICQGRRGEAEEVVGRAMTIEKQLVRIQLAMQKDASGRPVISMCQPDLHFCREEYAEARTLYREKVEFWEGQASRPETIELGRLQMRLAQSEARTGHAAEAIAMYDRARATFEREWCEGHAKAAAARDAMNGAGAIADSSPA
jgi:tetratricopeptide (TPR) repeat protein